MPGLAASSMVFENIRLENPNYQLYRLDWIQPKKNESIKSYCLRLSKKIKHKQPILLGVSFGGIIVVDEAYVDFSSKGTAISLINKYPNIYILNFQSHCLETHLANLVTFLIIFPVI